MSNKNDELMENTLPQENVSGDTVRYTLPEGNAYAAPSAPPRRRRSDRYKNLAIQLEETLPEDAPQAESAPAELPAAEELDALMKSVGLPLEPGYLGIDRQTLQQTFRATKDIRDKYVLSRLAWDLGILEDLCQLL